MLVDTGRLCQLLGRWTGRMRLVVLMACGISNSGEPRPVTGSVA